MDVLHESGFAELVEGLSLVTRADQRLRNLEDRLKHYKVTVDEDSFKNIKHYIDKLHADLAQSVLKHADAVAAERGGK